MSRKNKSTSVPPLPELSASDISAILAALPVVLCARFDVSDSQMSLNQSLVESAGAKIIKSRTDFTANEIRVISAALTASHHLLFGDMPDVISPADVDSATLSEIRDNFFAINRLYPIFDDYLSRHLGM